MPGMAKRGTVLPLYRLILRTEISVMQGQALGLAADFRGLLDDVL